MLGRESAPATDIHDRDVKCVFPLVREVGMFSTFLDERCVVLLGHAGAGKTSLFGHFSAQEDARLTDAARLLGLGARADWAGRTVYVDALDEQRAGNDLGETLASVVRALRESGVARIRIACRAADWYASTASSMPLGEYLGEYQVLMLEPLTEVQILEMLQSLGVEDPADFVGQARQRGLHELLGNPQNLLMLQKSVERGAAWPTGRYALYQGAVEELLAEHNKQHRHTRRSYRPEELCSVSGGLCALRLLSEMGGIALVPRDDEQFPYYRDIALDDEDLMLAALGRRIFAPTGDEIMDSSHRTVAEFLAAKWLAGRIAAGLPLGRVRALMGVEGTPVSSLRGVHAWLAVMLDIDRPDEASELIAADPIGVLVYADGGKLKSASKRRLLQTLAADSAPSGSEYGGLLSELNLGRLSGVEMVEIFQEALSATCTDTHLRTVVLDAMRLGQPRPELTDELLHILNDSEDPGREASLEALLSLPEPPYDLLAETYARVGGAYQELPLKTALLAALYGRRLRTQDVLDLLEQAQASSDGLNLSKLPHLDVRVSDEDAPVLLEGLHDSWRRQPQLAQSPAAFRVLGLIDALLTRVLERIEGCEPGNLFGWLSLRYHYSGGGEFMPDSPAVVRALSARDDVLNGLADHSLRLLAAGAVDYTRIMELRDISFKLMTAGILAGRAVALLRNPAADWDMESLYDAAIRLAHEKGERAAEHLAFLSDLARGVPTLAEVEAKVRVQVQVKPVGKAVCTPAPGPRRRWIAAHILENDAEIRAGDSVEVLAEVSELYYPQNGPYGMERLREELGEDACSTVAEGLIAFATRADVAPLPEVLELAVNNQLPKSRYAIAAGIELAHSTFPPEVLQAKLAVVTLLNSYVRGRRRLFALPTGAQLWEKDIRRLHPELAVNTYERLARECMARGAPSVEGLGQLCGDPALMPYSRQAALGILRDHPDVDEARARILLPFVLNNGSADENKRLLASMLEQTAASPHGHGYLMWLATAMVLEPRRHDAAVAAAAASAPAGLVDALYLVCSMRSLRPIGLHKLDIDAIGTLSDFVVAHARAGHLKSFMTHAHQLIVMLIDLLETSPDPGAGSLLRLMVENPALAPFKARVERALPKQHTLSVDSHHHQFRWRDILARLHNGPPASVEDLQALVMDHMKKIQLDVVGSSFNFHKLFWNEDEHGRGTKEKCENSARDVLMGLLAYRLAPYGVDVQPEGSMRDSKRVDILLNHGDLKLVIELKRESHANLWTAVQDQLDRYTRLPQTCGRGIFGVFWYGKTHSTSPETLCEDLRKSIGPRMSERIKVFVLDVSVPKGSANPPKTTTRKSAPLKKTAGGKS
jgi:hypothetical protein